MPLLQVELPDELQNFVAERQQVHECDSAGDYLEYLLRMEMLRLQHDEVDAMLLEGLESGPAIPLTKNTWKDLRDRIQDRLVQAKLT